MRSPRLEKHNGVWVVRDDILAGGTKTRIFMALMRARDEAEFVYASPANGLAQVALSVAAYQVCKQATIFVAKRSTWSPRTVEAASYGARIIEVEPGYLTVVQARAREYAASREAFMVPFGGSGEFSSVITDAAAALQIDPSEVWCAAGSGTLARALKQAWPSAKLHAVQVGKACALSDDITRHRSDYAYHRACRFPVPFSSDRFYEAKAWEILSREQWRRVGDVVFWNVAGAV
ncbi:PLP-dependent lyase/thiolase [Agrobacterium vitis]|nr:PLP-dependent lyase/thiolase [Agrobacterium vitis]UJL74727.1 pyridoxal-phosphate dependent enzyme [Agrobacterium vitis]